MIKLVRVLLVLVVISFFFSVAAQASKELVVMTKITPPLVSKTDNNYIGYSSEIWQEIAQRNNYITNWKQSGSVDSLISSVENGDADLGISAVSQTAEREKTVDFSYPYLSAGLQIISNKSSLKISDYLRIFVNSGAIRILYVGIVLILFVAHIYWLIKIFTDKKFPKNYFYGVWEGVWWASVGLFQADYGEERPRSRKGQFVLIIWLFISLVFLAQLEAVVTAEYTADRLRSDVSSLTDIVGIQVGVVSKTTGQIYAENQGLNFIEYSKTSDLLEAVAKGEIEAGITDAPIIQFYKSHGGKGRVQDGEVLKPESYAIVFPLESSLRKEVNSAILEMEADGTMSRIYDKWFPNSD